ncbi:MAG TPA: histidine--tRNA ligase [Thermoanaerobaculia bacterium]
MIASVKGTRDLLPPETRVWNRVETVAREVFALHAFDEIRTPVLESTDLFVRTVGESTDIVHKEMYTFTDRGGRSVTLRPENTAGVARAFVEHGLALGGGVRKLYYIGPQFRYERPQKGRYREFRQIGAEVLGAADPATDAEVLSMLFDFLGRLGFTGLAVALNSVGTDACRGAYVDALRAYFAHHTGRMGEDDRRRLEQNPLRVLDTKDAAVKVLVDDAPRMLDFLDAESATHHEELLALLDAEGIPYRIEPRLVRGLDYYTRTVFEVTAGGLGAQDALLGGGRYDRLVSDLGGPKTPGIGFAIGEDRLVDVLPPAFREEAMRAFSAVALIPLDRGDRAAALELARKLRAAGIAVDLDPAGKGPGAGLKGAERRGLTVAVLLGEREREAGTVVVKDLASRTQESVPVDRLAEYLKES